MKSKIGSRWIKLLGESLVKESLLFGTIDRRLLLRQDRGPGWLHESGTLEEGACSFVLSIPPNLSSCGMIIL